MAERLPDREGLVQLDNAKPRGVAAVVKSWFFIDKNSRPDALLMLLSGFFFVNTMTAEVISGKLFVLGPFVLSMGSIMWPVVFIFTDVINEYYGRKIVRRLTIVTSTTLLWVFLLLFIAIGIPAADFSPIDDPTFATVFAQGSWIIVGSLTAFVVSQVLDITVFHFLRVRTRNRHLWLRTTGSTLFSQLADTFIVSGIAFLLPGKITLEVYLNLCSISYGYKVIVAIVLTPAIYGVHYVIDRFLGKQTAQEMQRACMAENEALDAADDAVFERLSTELRRRPADGEPESLQLVTLESDVASEAASPASPLHTASPHVSPTHTPARARRGSSTHSLHSEPSD